MMSSSTSTGRTDSNDSTLLVKSPENTNVAKYDSSVAEQVLRRFPSLSGVVVLGPESKQAKANDHDGNTIQSNLENIVSESLNGESNAGISIYENTHMADHNGQCDP